MDEQSIVSEESKKPKLSAARDIDSSTDSNGKSLLTSSKNSSSLAQTSSSSSAIESKEIVEKECKQQSALKHSAEVVLSDPRRYVDLFALKLIEDATFLNSRDIYITLKKIRLA